MSEDDIVQSQENKKPRKPHEKHTITIEPLRRLMKEAGGERVSDDAAKELSKYLETKTIELLKEAEKIAKHSGRVTIIREDVKLAKRVVFRE